MGATSILNSSEQQAVYASKQKTRTLRKSSTALHSKSSGKFGATTTRNIHGGFLSCPPPFLSLTYPPSAPLYNHMVTPKHRYINNYGHQQPPLLPSPSIDTYYNSLPSLTRGISCPPPSTRKTKAKKQKPVKKGLVVVSKGSSPSGPDPNELPIEFPKVLSLSPKANCGGLSSSASVTDMDNFSASVFATSPPPSSLPLPKFTVRPKLACKAEAAGALDGVTDNLRRILRL